MSMLVNPFAQGGGGGGGGTDPNFSSVVMLLHLDDGNGATTYHDSSLMATDSIDIGGTSVTTTNPQFGSGCLNVVNGRTGATHATAYKPGTGDFTWEFSFRTASPAQVKNLCDFGNEVGNPTTAWIIYISSSQYVFYQNSTDRIRGGTVSTNAWDQIAVSRNSGTTRLLVNGTSIGTFADSNNYSSIGTINIGGDANSSANSTGTFDECRYTVGVGRYTGNYTPAVTAFPDS